MEEGSRKDEGNRVMNWEERIKQSDAGKLMPKRAKEIVKEAKEKESPKPVVDASVLRKEFS